MIPICVPSLGKATTSLTLKKLASENMLTNTYIFVYDFEKEDYANQFPEANVISVGNTKNLPNKRNFILDYGVSQGWKNLLMIDDDIKGFCLKRINSDKVEPIKTYKEFLDYLEDIDKQLNGDYTAICPRWNFISCDKLADDNLLIEYSQFAAVILFNLENLKDMRYDQCKLEDIDLYIRLVLNNHKVYKLRQIQAFSTLAQSGGYQTYMDVSSRFSDGIKELHNKFEHSDDFLKPTTRGYAGMRKPAFKKWLRTYHPDVIIHELPKIRGIS